MLYIQRIRPLTWPRIVFVFVTATVATRDIIAGGFFLVVYLSAVVLGRVVYKWFLNIAADFLLAGVRNFHIFFGSFQDIQNSIDWMGRKRILLRRALAGRLPGRIRELLVHEEEWTHHILYAYLRCEPSELRSILERYPFARWQKKLDYFKFSAAPFPRLEKLPAREDIVVFERVDLAHSAESCRIFTDVDFSFAYVTYGLD